MGGVCCRYESLAAGKSLDLSDWLGEFLRAEI